MARIATQLIGNGTFVEGGEKWRQTLTPRQRIIHVCWFNTWKIPVTIEFLVSEHFLALSLEDPGDGLLPNLSAARPPEQR